MPDKHTLSTAVKQTNDTQQQEQNRSAFKHVA